MISGSQQGDRHQMVIDAVDIARTGLKSLGEMGVSDAVQMVLIVVAIAVVVLVAIKVTSKLLKWVVIIGVIVVAAFLLFGADPMGIGSHIMYYMGLIKG